MPAACIRIGLQTGDVRPLKVVLNSAANGDSVQRAAKHLKGSKTFIRVRAALFLTQDKLFKDKARREQCKKLNEDAGATD